MGRIWSRPVNAPCRRHGGPPLGLSWNVVRQTKPIGSTPPPADRTIRAPDGVDTRSRCTNKANFAQARGYADVRPQGDHPGLFCETKPVHRDGQGRTGEDMPGRAVGIRAKQSQFAPRGREHKRLKPKELR